VKVLVVMPLAERLGGAETMLVAFAEHAADVGIEAEVVLQQAGSLEDELARRGVASTVIESGRLRAALSAMRAVRRLRRHAQRTQPDVIVSWMAKAHLYAAPALVGTRLSKRLVWWQHTVPRGHWMDRAATALPTAAIGCSSGAAAEAQRTLRPRRPTFVVHPGLDVVAPRTARAETRAALGIPHERFVVVLVGRLQPWKGQLRAIEAVEHLVSTGLDVHLLLVGGAAHGLSPEYAAEVAERAGRTDRVTMAGQVADVLPHVAAADVLLNASAQEPFGLVLLEAMALEVPVVAVDAGGPREIIEHGESGWLLPDTHPETVAAGLGRLARDDSLRRMLARGGRKRYAERFTAARMTERIAAELRRVGGAAR
jgi:glycosyltransferase involved in cell wall biosynthesis